MARPKQDGLLYFSFDTDFFYADKRVKRFHSKYGNDGLIFYIYLLTEIYRNGYYISWDEESAEDAAADLNLKEGFTEQALTYLASRSLLTVSKLASSVTVITSPGIQKRYQEAVKGRKRQIEVNSEIWLLNEEETASCIKVIHNQSNSEKNQGNSEKNQSNSEKNHIKESKEKESNNTISKDIVRQTDVRRALDEWNQLVEVGVKPVSRLNNDTNRYKMLLARIREYGIDEVLKAIQKIRCSKFLRGGSASGWTIDFDWFVRPNNFPKVLEGKYDDSDAGKESKSVNTDKWQ